MKRQYFKKSVALILIFVLILSLVSCNNPKQQEEIKQSIKDRIASLDSVESVEIVAYKHIKCCDV